MVIRKFASNSLFDDIFMKNFLYDLQLFFEKLDSWRDKALFAILKPFWPRRITPNHLTILRIIIAIGLFVLLFYFHTTSKALVVWLFLVGALTDLLDGSIARAFGQETNVGAMLDPISDRMLIIPIAIYSLFDSHRWLFLTIILLEIINGLISAWGHGKNIFIKADIFGKVKMVLQSVVFLAILIFWPSQPHIFFIYILWLSVYLIIASIFFKILYIKDHPIT